MDARTGQVLARKRSGEEAAPASLTKMMTVLLATEALPDLDTPVTLPEDIFPALYKADASMAGFQPGETVTVRDLLYGAMLPSGAECCEALARQVSGSEEAFVALMNRKAGELGMKHTHFANCTGLTSPEHYSSAADLAVLLQAALNNETFRTVFTTGQYTSSVTEQHPKGLYMASTLLSRLDGGEVTGGQILGGKTGYTRAAGYCLVSSAERNGVRILAVAMGCDGPLNADIEECYNFVDSRTLYDWAFDNFSYRSILSSTEPITKVNVEMAEGDGTVMLYPAGNLNVLMPNEVSNDAIEREVTIYDQRLVAPLPAGTVLGEIRLSAGGESYGTVKLITGADVELSRSAYISQRLGEIFSKGWVIALLIIVIAFAVIYTVLVARYRKLRRKHLEERRRAEQRRRARQEREENSARGYTTIDPDERFDANIDMSDFFDDDNNYR